jgi:hypothetical protein
VPGSGQQPTADNGLIRGIGPWALTAFAIFAIVVTAGALWLLALSGQFIYLVKLTLIARVTVYAITCATLVILRHLNSAPEASFNAPGGEVLAYASALPSVAGRRAHEMRTDHDGACCEPLCGFWMANHWRFN